MVLNMTSSMVLIIKELAEEFEGQFKCLGENTEKYMNFSVPIKKELENGKTMIYKIKFIDSFRFTSISLLNLVDNLSEGLHNDKCADCKSCLEHISIKEELLVFYCSNCNKNYEKEFHKDLIKRFENTYEICNGDISKSIFLLRKGIYSYEYMGSWKRFDKTVLPNKEDFYSNLNMEDIIDADHKHAKKHMERI